MRLPACLAALALLAATGAANAASGDAWAEFARTVEEKCIAAARAVIEEPQAVVDPYGSEGFGLALVTGRAKGTDTTISHICVMDKGTQAVELGGELPAEQVRVTPAQ
jgi:hypothetical protein